MGKVTRGFTVEERVGHAQAVKQFGQDNATHAVDRVHTNVEMSIAYSLSINQFQVKNRLYVLVVKGVVGCVMPQCVNASILVIALFRYVEHLVPVAFRQKFALVVEQFQGVPLPRIMACGYYNATVSLGKPYCQFRSRGGCEPYVNHIVAHTHECAADNAVHHVARQTCVTSNNNLSAV